MAPLAQSDLALLTRLRERDPATLAATVQEHATPLYRAARALRFSEQDAGDLLREVEELDSKDIRNNLQITVTHFGVLIHRARTFTAVPGGQRMGLIHIMNCREIATLLETDQAQNQSCITRIQVRVHIWTCWHCRRLLRQITWLRKVALQSVNEIPPDPGLEERIVQKLLH
jgi:hypothetical protein